MGVRYTDGSYDPHKWKAVVPASSGYTEDPPGRWQTPGTRPSNPSSSQATRSSPRTSAAAPSTASSSRTSTYTTAEAQTSKTSKKPPSISKHGTTWTLPGSRSSAQATAAS